MPEQPYNPVGAIGGLFAPAYIHGNPESEAAVAQWQKENFALTPEMIEATRGPSTTITNPVVGGQFRTGLGGGGTTTIPGSVDPEALKIYAQGGKYTPKPKTAGGGGTAAIDPAVSAQRDAITGAILSAGRIPDATAGSLIAPSRDVPPPGMQYAYSPLRGLMGEGDPGFMIGSAAGGV